MNLFAGSPRLSELDDGGNTDYEISGTDLIIHPPHPPHRKKRKKKKESICHPLRWL